MTSPTEVRSAGFPDRIASTDVEYHDASATYRTQFDSHSRSACEAIIAAVEAATGTDPLELPPLNSAIDPDALDDLFTGTRPDGSVTFHYAGCEVVVNGHGTVVATPA